MAEAAICRGCGATVPAGRDRCGRCGAPVDNAAVPQAAQKKTGRLQLAALSGAIVAAGTLFALVPRSPEPAALVAAPATSPLVSQRTAEVPEAPIATADPVFAGSDSSRAAIAAYNDGDIALALTTFKSAVESDPANAEALNNLGQALVRTGRAREAIPYFDRAIVLTADVWSYHFNRARAFGELKEWRQAVAGYTDAARLFPDDYVTQFNLARAREASGDLPGAVQAYAKAAELAPGQADFRLWYARALDLNGNSHEAVAEYRRFLALEPDASRAEKVRARLTELGEAPIASS